MIGSRTKLACVSVVVVLFAGNAYAQEGGNAQLRVTEQRLRLQPRPFLAIEPMTVRHADSRRPLALQVSPGRPRGSISRKVGAGIVGAIGGFFGGGYLGAKIEPSCHCDDPGLRGFIVGAPIGAVIGGILGAKLF